MPEAFPQIAKIREPRLRNTATSAIRGLTPLLTSLFENVDDALFDMAEKAVSNRDQMGFFDGMREIRKSREAVETSFLGDVVDSFVDFFEGRLGPCQLVQQPKEGGELSLVDDAELEKDLAISDIAARADRQNSRELYALAARLGTIKGLSEFEHLPIPLQPPRLAISFRGACESIDIELKVLLILYKLADRFVFARLGGLYAQLNKELAGKGILPSVLAAPRQRIGQGSPGTAGGAAGPGAEAAQSESLDDEAAIDPLGDDNMVAPRSAMPDGQGITDGPGLAQQVQQNSQLAELLNMLGGGSQPPSGDAADQGPGSGYPDPGSAPGNAMPPSTGPASAAPAAAPEMIYAAALDRLAQRFAAPPATGAPPTDAPPAPSLHSALEEEEAALGYSDVASSTDEGRLLRLIALLFENLGGQQNLPGPVRQAMQPLAVPYMRAALKDTSAVTDAEHPARRLLEMLGRLGSTWNPTGEGKDKSFDQLTRIVTRAVEESENDPEVFDDLCDEMDKFMKRRERRASVQEKRATEAQRGQERLAVAKQRAAREIRKRLAVGVDDVIEKLLRGPWKNVLTLTAVRHGPESTQFKRFVKAIDSAAETFKAGERMTPATATAFNEGLKMVAMHDEDIEKIIRRLGGIADPDPEFEDPLAVEEEGEGWLEEADPIEDTVPPLESTEGGKSESPGDGDGAPGPIMPKQLEVGDWVEFTTADGESVRAKISWRSPITKKLLFVNDSGVKVCDKTQEDVFAEIKRGEARFLENSPVFERTLDSVLDRLRERTGVGASKEANS